MADPRLLINQKLINCLVCPLFTIFFIFNVLLHFLKKHHGSNYFAPCVPAWNLGKKTFLVNWITVLGSKGLLNGLEFCDAYNNAYNATRQKGQFLNTSFVSISGWISYSLVAQILKLPIEFQLLNQRWNKFQWYQLQCW